MARVAREDGDGAGEDGFVGAEGGDPEAPRAEDGLRAEEAVPVGGGRDLGGVAVVEAETPEGVHVGPSAVVGAVPRAEEEPLPLIRAGVEARVQEGPNRLRPGARGARREADGHGRHTRGRPFGDVRRPHLHSLRRRRRRNPGAAVVVRRRKRAVAGDQKKDASLLPCLRRLEGRPIDAGDVRGLGRRQREGRDERLPRLVAARRRGIEDVLVGDGAVGPDPEAPPAQQRFVGIRRPRRPRRPAVVRGHGRRAAPELAVDLAKRNRPRTNRLFRAVDRDAHRALARRADAHHDQQQPIHTTT
mmetsp:Transcript_1785/g.6001  ORF Transcript_1785/g.6001 Transcript_1785/m.6001 type:complete len:302 (+) Transcript_1785:302-1207(+)